MQKTEIGNRIFADFNIAEFQMVTISPDSPSPFSIRENTGRSTVLIEPITIPMNGSSVKPLEKIANASFPKYRLTKNWLTDVESIPQMDTNNRGMENFRISLYDSSV